MAQDLIKTIQNSVIINVKNKLPISQTIIESLKLLQKANAKESVKDLLALKIIASYENQIKDNINPKYKEFKIKNLKTNEEILNEYKNAYTLKLTSIEQYPLIWNNLQIHEINSMLNRSMELMSDTERKEFYQVMDEIMFYHKFISYKDFKLRFIKIFGGVSYLTKATTFESNSPFVSQKGIFNEAPAKIIFIFLTTMKAIIKGGAVNFNKNNNQLLKPPFLTNRWKGLYQNWNTFAHQNLQRLFNEAIELHYPEIVKYNNTLKIDEDKIPYSYLLRLPKYINLGYMNVRWDFTGIQSGIRGGFYDGFFSWGKSTEAVYSIELHEWGLFWALINKYEEYIKQTFHHEIIHLIEDRYARIYDLMKANKIDPVNIPLFKKAMEIWKVHPDDSDSNYKITTKYNQNPKTLKEIYEIICKNRKITSMKDYLNAFHGHDFAFVKEIRNYDLKASCKEANIQRGKIESIYSIMFYKEIGENMGKGRWIGCIPIPNQPEVSEEASTEKFT